jgi:phage regulator Rha-like protein
MSSREIAELTGKRHDSVKRTIETLEERGVIESPQIVEIPTATKTGTEYRLGKRDTYVLVAQLSPEFTAALVDRWQALEASQAPAIPQTYAAALMAAAQAEMAREALALENSKQAEVIARWLGSKFAVWCDVVIDNILRGKADVVITQTEISEILKMPATLREAGKLWIAAMERSPITGELLARDSADFSAQLTDHEQP